MKHPRVRRRSFFLMIAAVAAVGGGAWYAKWSFLDHRFCVVTPDRVYQSGAMPTAELAEVVREHGIRTVIDLRLDDEGDAEAEREALEAQAVRYARIPSEHAPRAETVETFLEIVRRPENLPVLIHCGHGEGRSVLFAAIYRIECEGWDNDRARRACRLLPWRGTFAPDGPKGRYLLHYKRHLGQASR